MKWYDVHELLKTALPQVPILREQPMRFDERAISWDSSDLRREGARLFADPGNRVDLRDLCRTTAPWFRRIQPPRDLDDLNVNTVSDIVPCDGDEWFREACGRVNDWLSTPVTYLHREDVAAHLGPFAAIECARQCSPAVRYALSLPEVAPIVEAFECGEQIDEDAWRAACLTLRSQLRYDTLLLPDAAFGVHIAYSIASGLIFGSANFEATAAYLQVERARRAGGAA